MFSNYPFSTTSIERKAIISYFGFSFMNFENEFKYLIYNLDKFCKNIYKTLNFKNKLINLINLLNNLLQRKDWGLGIGDWPNPQSPIPNPQSPFI